MTDPLALVTWDRRDPTGGNIYNEGLAAALRSLGQPVEFVRLAGPWPAGDAVAHRRLADALAASRVAVVDGVVGSNAPGPVADAVGIGRRVFLLVHLPLGTAAEASTVRAASGVICTSRHTADRLLATAGPAVIARPGVEAAPIAAGSAPPRIVCVANLLPNKDQLNVVQALALVTDLPWTARLIGSEDTDRPYAAAVRRRIADFGLADRVILTGALRGGELESEWSAADLLVLVSRQEAYGMAVAEALARGVPAVVGRGTGAVEALAGSTPTASELAGALVPPGESGGLATVLRDWLADADQRTRWRAAARHRRTELPTWLDTARVVTAAIGAPAGPNRPS